MLRSPKRFEDEKVPCIKDMLKGPGDWVDVEKFEGKKKGLMMKTDDEVMKRVRQS
jgi:hypothetical protein